MNFKKPIAIWLVTISIIFFFPKIILSQQPIQLIVRADDMGMVYDRGLAIIKAYKEGIVTSASVMPASPFFEEAVLLCKANPNLSIGVHITLLGERERPALSPGLIPSLVTQSGFFYESIDKLENANPSVEELEKEIRAQVNKAIASGLKFDYIDYHIGIPDAAKIIIQRLCLEQKLLYGHVDNGTICGFNLIVRKGIESFPYIIFPDMKIGWYEAPALSTEKKQVFFNILNELEPGGRYVLIVHPSFYGPQRASILELLCSPEAKEIVHNKNIQLVSYRDIWEKEFVK